LNTDHNLSSPLPEDDHPAIPDDLPEPGDRCKVCRKPITWTGPTSMDWEHRGASLPEPYRKERGHNFWPSPAELAKVPALYATDDGRPMEEKVVYLHYFCAGSDWWVAELDPETAVAFGYVCLGGDAYNAEWGNIDLSEVIPVAESR
jgi:hypothetical protein